MLVPPQAHETVGSQLSQPGGGVQSRNRQM